VIDLGIRDTESGSTLEWIGFRNMDTGIKNYEDLEVIRVANYPNLRCWLVGHGINQKLY